jgi:DNA adenine methylase
VNRENEDRARLMQARPFLKWAGGKRQLLPHLLAKVPLTYGTYFEPFVGGGALFFALNPRPRKAVLTDLNLELVRTYQGLRDDVNTVVAHLRGHARQHDALYFNEMAEERWTEWIPARVAARMIYLNKTCFNGLYRVNSRNLFNVPIGRSKRPPTICDENNLRACSAALQGVTIEPWDFQYAIRKARSGDFIYADPPYIPRSDTAKFTSYTRDRFTIYDHEALAWSCMHAKERGVRVLISAAGNAESLRVYGEFHRNHVMGRRAINSNGAGRGAVLELLCT